VRLLKHEEIKFSRQIFSEQMTFTKTNEHFRTKFIHQRTTFYENFKTLRLNEQKTNEKRPFSVFFYFFSTKLIDQF